MIAECPLSRVFPAIPGRAHWRIFNSFQGSLQSPGPHWRIFKTTSEVPDPKNGQWDKQIAHPVKIPLDDFQAGLDYITVGRVRVEADRQRLRAFSAWARDEASREHGWERHFRDSVTPVCEGLRQWPGPYRWESTTMDSSRRARLSSWGSARTPAGAFVYQDGNYREPDSARRDGDTSDTYSDRDLWRGIGHWTVPSRSGTGPVVDLEASRTAFDPAVQKLFPPEGPLYLPGSSTPFVKNPPPTPYTPYRPVSPYTPYRPVSPYSPKTPYQPRPGHSHSSKNDSDHTPLVIVLVALVGIGLLVAFVCCAVGSCGGSKQQDGGTTDPNYGVRSSNNLGSQPDQPQPAVYGQPPGPYNYPGRGYGATGPYGATPGLYAGSNVPGGASFRPGGTMPMYGRPMGAPMGGFGQPGMMMRPGGFPGGQMMPGQMPPGQMPCGGGGMTSSQAAAVYGS